jgi:glycosyltransferase involved in cell wall biosynthesis
VAEVTVDGETGRLVPPGDAAALRTALAELLAQPQLGIRWGEAGRRRARERYRIADMVARLAAWYLELGERVKKATGRDER